MSCGMNPFVEVVAELHCSQNDGGCLKLPVASFAQKMFGETPTTGEQD
jgi:hypothetical protein